MDHEVESVDLILENCECITIERKHIGSFWCDEITDTIARIACNAIRKHQRCKEFFIEIHRDANKRYDVFGVLSEHTVFERLSAYQDITSVTVKYRNGDTEDIILPWKDADENGCSNTYQTSLVGECGDMYICVCDGKSVMDLIDFESVNDKGTTDIHWDLLMEDQI